MYLYDSELKIMNVLWTCKGDLSAGRIYQLIKHETKWHRNTVYSVINKCIDKGAIRRYEPYFMCHATIDQTDIQNEYINTLIDNHFDGSHESFIRNFIKSNYLPIEHIRSKLNNAC